MERLTYFLNFLNSLNIQSKDNCTADSSTEFWHEFQWYTWIRTINSASTNFKPANVSGTSTSQQPFATASRLHLGDPKILVQLCLGILQRDKFGSKVPLKVTPKAVILSFLHILKPMVGKSSIKKRENIFRNILCYINVLVARRRYRDNWLRNLLTDS